MLSTAALSPIEESILLLGPTSEDFPPEKALIGNRNPNQHVSACFGN